jgi:hypothetical protein
MNEEDLECLNCRHCDGNLCEVTGKDIYNEILEYGFPDWCPLLDDDELDEADEETFDEEE